MRELKAKSLAALPEMFVTADRLEDGHRRVVMIHAPEACVPPCAIHAPSEHPLAGAPLVFRSAGPLIGWVWVRICAHGVEHVDPDAITRLQAVGLPVEVHGDCECGCCHREVS